MSIALPLSLDDLLRGLTTRDPAAARVLHDAYLPRLVSLARDRLGPGLRLKTEPESAVQSALGSFFTRYDRGEFRIQSWDELWSLLAVITIRKTVNRARYFRQQRRDIAREVPQAPDGTAEIQPVDPQPSPMEAVILAETLALAMTGLGDADRKIIEWLLAGHTIDETRRLADCGERTVRRVRDRVRAKLKQIDDSLGID